jgi:hypothetical protein
MRDAGGIRFRVDLNRQLRQLQFHNDTDFTIQVEAFFNKAQLSVQITNTTQYFFQKRCLFSAPKH